MTVLIHLKNQLEPLEIDGDFNDFQNALNIGASKGWTFITFQLDDGRRVAPQIGNINYVEEVEALGGIG